MPYFQLSTDPKKSRQDLQHLINLPDITLVLILGNDQTAKDAQDYAKALLDAALNANLQDYKTVYFIPIPDPEIVLPVISQLPSNDVELNNLADYIVLTISPAKNLLSYLLSKADFHIAKGYIKVAILKAMANN